MQRTLHCSAKNLYNCNKSREQPFYKKLRQEQARPTRDQPVENPAFRTCLWIRDVAEAALRVDQVPDPVRMLTLQMIEAQWPTTLARGVYTAQLKGGS